MSEFIGENRTIIGAADEYERQTGQGFERRPRLSFDISRGYGIPMIADVSAEEIESMSVMQLRREAAEFKK